MTYTEEQLKKMSSEELTKATNFLPMDVRLKIAILAGAGNKGIQVYEGKDMSNGKFSQEKLNYKALADILNHHEVSDFLNYSTLGFIKLSEEYEKEEMEKERRK